MSKPNICTRCDPYFNFPGKIIPTDSKGNCVACGYLVADAPWHSQVAKRDQWDSYFMEIANVIASNSKCLSRQIGALLVRGKSIITTGYNGPPRRASHCSERTDEPLRRALLDQNISAWDHRMCPRRILQYESGQGLHICTASHAEANCIANAARNGVNTNGTTLYLNCVLPCKNCMALIINAGIDEVVCLPGDYDTLSWHLASEGGIEVRRYGS